MNAVKNALTRKFGPLPAWTWAIVLGVATYFFRNRAGAGAGAGDGSGTLPYVGPYGQDYYPLPGSGGATTGGGGDGSGSGSGNENGSNPSSNPPVVNVNIPGDGSKGQPGTGKHPKRHPKPKKPKYAPKGSEHTGTKKPGKGWRGIGGGWWAPPGKHTKPRGGAGRTATGRNRGSVTTGSDRVGKTRPSGGAGLTHSGRKTTAPKAGTATRRKHVH